MTDLKDRWVELVSELALNPLPNRMISSGIKYFHDVTFEITGEEWNNGFPVTMDALGYGERSTKMNQLIRNYFNINEVNQARDKIIERFNKKSDYTSVAFSMRGQEKDSRSQGHCMSTTVITCNPKSFISEKPELSIDIYYRVTEVVKKFGADLIFLHDVVIPKALPEPYLTPTCINTVKFHFANIYFSPLFLPIMVPQMDVINLMYNIYKTQPFESLRGCYNALANLAVDPEHFSYKTRRKMCSFLQNNVGEDRLKYLDLLNKLHELNPKLREVKV